MQETRIEEELKKIYKEINFKVTLDNKRFNHYNIEISIKDKFYNMFYSYNNYETFFENIKKISEIVDKTILQYYHSI